MLDGSRYFSSFPDERPPARVEVEPPRRPLMTPALRAALDDLSDLLAAARTTSERQQG